MRRALIVLAAAGIFFVPATAKQGKGHGKGQGQGKGHGTGHEKKAAVAFASADRSVLTTYYRTNGLPPGLAKRGGDLPPGLEKQLRRNGRLPPGLEKKMMFFPAEIETRLPPCPPDVHRGFLGGVAVMYNSRTGLVLDAFAIAGR
jgi:hypothetical protein